MTVIPGHVMDDRLKTRLESLTPLQLRQRAANVVVPPRLKPTPFKDAVDVEPVPSAQISVLGRTFNYHDDLPLNRRGFKYKPCRAIPIFPSNLYLTTEYAPFAARVLYFDRSPGVACSEDMAAITTLHGWLSARSNVAMREGTFYFEYNVVNSGGKSHVRLGIGRKEAALEAPVGFDGYGYGLRDVTGEKITLSRPKAYMNESFGSGDTIGLLVLLPPLETQRAYLREFDHKRRKTEFAAHNIVRDQVPIKYKNALFYEQYEYSATRQMEHLLNPVTVFGEKAIVETNVDQVPTIPGSYVVAYKNGRCLGPMFEDLYAFLPLQDNLKQSQNQGYNNTDDGSLGYYPMMSVFSEGTVELNPGPQFKFELPKGARALSERYDEQVVEEWLWDLIEEVEAQYIDSFID